MGLWPIQKLHWRQCCYREKRTERNVCIVTVIVNYGVKLNKKHQAVWFSTVLGVFG